MRHKLFRLLTLFIFIAGLASCAVDEHYNDDKGYYNAGNWVGYGVVIVAGGAELSSGSAMTIRMDDRNTLYVRENSVAGYEPKVNDRVMVNYTILGGAPGEVSISPAYTVRLNAVSLVPAPAVLRKSFVDDDPAKRTDSLGMSPVVIRKLWFGGDFLNIDFGGTAQEGLVNAVWDDTTMNGDTLFISLRHNAATHRLRSSVVSFNIAALLPRGIDEIQVKFTWLNLSNEHLGSNGSQTVYEKGLFRRGYQTVF